MEAPEGLAAYVLGVTALMEGDDGAAIAQFDEAIRLDPRLAAAYAERDIARERKGDREGALADDNEAIRLDPKTPAPTANGPGSGRPARIRSTATASGRSNRRRAPAN